MMTGVRVWQPAWTIGILEIVHGSDLGRVAPQLTQEYAGALRALILIATAVSSCDPTTPPDTVLVQVAMWEPPEEWRL